MRMATSASVEILAASGAIMPMIRATRHHATRFWRPSGVSGAQCIHIKCQSGDSGRFWRHDAQCSRCYRRQPTEELTTKSLG